MCKNIITYKNCKITGMQRQTYSMSLSFSLYRGTFTMVSCMGRAGTHGRTEWSMRCVVHVSVCVCGVMMRSEVYQAATFPWSLLFLSTFIGLHSTCKYMLGYNEGWVAPEQKKKCQKHHNTHTLWTPQWSDKELHT